MKRDLLPREVSDRRKATEKSSGKTPGKPNRVARLSRRDADIPADRGARERKSSTQGSE